MIFINPKRKVTARSIGSPLWTRMELAYLDDGEGTV